MPQKKLLQLLAKINLNSLKTNKNEQEILKNSQCQLISKANFMKLLSLSHFPFPD